MKHRLNWAGRNIDEVLVELAVIGRKHDYLNHDERLAAVDIMSLQGVPPTEMANRIGCHKRTVERLLADLKAMFNPEPEVDDGRAA